jgi:2,3-bisphosphoglycerate-independent phosphoglycerate mutase
MNPRPRPLLLCILDGWGDRPERADNAIAQAKTPVWHELMKRWPHSELEASEHYVGLPDGQMGNSEVGHTNIGAGRIVMQDLPRIDAAVDDGSLATMPGLKEFIVRVKEKGGTAHVFGLISPGGVHSHQRQIAALARILHEAEVPIAIHAVLDGRDTPPKSALGYLEQFHADTGDIPIATVSGRYYAMDRDRRWDRVAKAYHTIAMAAGEHADDPLAAVEAAYGRGETDEFVLPTAIGAYAGMQDGDGILFANFRADRIREVGAALVDPDFTGFEREKQVRFAAALGLVEYSEDLNRFLATLFPPFDLHDTIGEVVAKAGLKQLRIAETEKYAHVTFFFNGGRETVFDGEERILVPSPKVATYDQQPQMSAPEVTDKVVDAIKSAKFDLIVLNYANTDMVGHTGDLAAATAAVETVDTCLGRIATALQQAGGALVITADHGNAEMMRDPQTGEPHTAHTLNPVPFVVVNAPAAIKHVDKGRLCDIAPTLLDLLGLATPPAMTGHSLIADDSGRRAAD